MTKKPTMEQTLAPDVERAWANEFILVLRMKGVAGAAIADALVEVNDYVRLSGEPAQEAFGPANEYADTLDLPSQPQQGLLPVVVPAILGYLGASLVTDAVHSLRDNIMVEFQVNEICLAVLLVLTLVFLAWKGPALLSVLAGHRRRSIVAGVIAWVWFCFILAQLPLGSEYVVAAVPPWPVIVIGVIALAVSSFVYIRMRRLPADPIEPPLKRMATGRQTIETWLWLPLALMFPVGTIVMSAIWLIF